LKIFLKPELKYLNLNGYIFEHKINELGPDEYLEITRGHNIDA
jgi:hypothetical protein